MITPFKFPGYSDAVILMGEPEIWALTYERRQTFSPEGERGGNADVEFQLALARQHKRHLVVMLSVAVKGLEWLTLHATHRLGFLIQGTLSDEEVQTLLEVIAFNVGPGTLYPFVRESMLTLTQKSGAHGVTLPLVNWPAHIEEMALEIPESDVAAPDELLTTFQGDLHAEAI